MTILAGLSPAGALIVRAGEPKVLNIALAQADGTTPQNLEGRTFALIVRRSSRIDPMFTIPAELSGDGLYVSVMIAAAKATAIYEAGYAQSLSYDFVELSGGASTSRFTERVLVQVAPNLPSDIVPIWEMLPYTEALIRPDAMVITERGAAGDGTPAIEAAQAAQDLIETLYIEGVAYFSGPLDPGEWRTLKIFPRLLFTGTGSAIFDAREAQGAVTAAVETYTFVSATDAIEYPFFGEDAAQARVATTGNLSVEII